MTACFRDPLLVKEFRNRLRARTVVTVQVLYVCALCVVLLLTLLGGGRAQPAWEAGASLFSMLVFTQAMLLLFVTPLVSASAVSGEKETKTFDSLMVTPVSPRRVALLKLAAVMAVFVILLAVSLPFAAAAFILGGVSTGDLLTAWCYTLLLSGAMGALGLYWSTRFDRSIASIPAAAVCAVLLGVVLPNFVDDGPMVLAGLSPTLFLENLFAGGKVQLFGRALPLWWLTFGLLLTLLGWWASAAVQRLRFERERSYRAARVFSLCAWALLLIGLLGETVAPAGRAGTPAQAREQLSSALEMVTVLLLAVAPWVGASLPVIRSERLRGMRERLPARLAATMLTQPAGYTLKLGGMAAAMVAVVAWQAGPLRTPLAVPCLAVLGTLLAAVCWALFSFRLSDRRGNRGRFIGLGAAYLLTACAVLAPSIVLEGLGAPAGGTPVWLQYAAVLSPFRMAEALSSPHEAAAALPAVVRACGARAIWASSPLFHGLLALLLAMPCWPSTTKRLARCQSRA
jgi:ABC-type transport system involved in multi-copper enzyme maturation permease subunit